MTTTDLPALAQALLSIRLWSAYDVDGEGRVLAGHDDTGSSQLVEIGPDGTRTRLTDLPGPCSGRYLPGQRAVVVQHDTDGDECSQLSLLDLESCTRPAALSDLEPLVHDARYHHNLQEVTATSLVFTTNRRNGVDFDVVVRDLTTGHEQVVFDDGGWAAQVAVSPSGQQCSIVSLSLRPNGTQLAVSAASQPTRLLTDPDEDSYHSHAGWLDEATLVLGSNRDREFQAIVAVPVDGGPWRVLVQDEGADLDAFPSPCGTAIAVARIDDGCESVAVYEADGTPRCRLDLPLLSLSGLRWSADATTILVSGSSPLDPGSIWLADARDGRTRRVIDGGADIDPTLRDRLTTPITHRVPAPDGEQVPCFVYPAHPQGDPGLAGAGVIHVHGGPESRAARLFNPVIQLLTASGLTVLVPNVRGSTGYGKRWYSLDDVELRMDSVADLAALHTWLPEAGVDPSRCALWGGSYGGYMVLAGLTMQPGLWAAGVDIVGISSLVTFLENTSAYRRAYREREYGSLEQHRELLEALSPITHLAALRSPLFVIHGANDPRVPLSEAEQIHEAVAAQGIRTELRVYPDEGHGLAKRANRIDAYPAAIAFLAEVLSR